MSSRRYLCSDLVSLTVNAAESVVNLEEIWREGAILDLEQPIELGSRIELRCDRELFTGRVTQVESHPFGWRAEIEFSQETQWTPERFRPQHMLEVSRECGPPKA